MQGRRIAVASTWHGPKLTVRRGHVGTQPPIYFRMVIHAANSWPTKYSSVTFADRCRPLGRAIQVDRFPGPLPSRACRGMLHRLVPHLLGVPRGPRGIAGIPEALGRPLPPTVVALPRRGPPAPRQPGGTALDRMRGCGPGRPPALRGLQRSCRRSAAPAGGPAERPDIGAVRSGKVDLPLRPSGGRGVRWCACRPIPEEIESVLTACPLQGIIHRAA